MTLGIGPAIDWTIGTGVFPAGGSISIPANTERQWFYVENRDVGEVTIAYSVNFPNGGSGQSTISLDPASASGKQGGTEERDATIFMPAQSAIVITGIAGQKVTVLTG